MSNRRVLHYILFFAFTLAFIGLGLLMPKAQTVRAATVDGDFAEQTNTITCLDCHTPEQSLIEETLEDCDACHDGKAIQAELGDPDDLQASVNQLTNRVMRFNHAATLVQRSDARYDQVLETLAHLRLETQADDTTLSLIANANALMMDLEREAESGYLVSEQANTTLQAITTTTLTSRSIGFAYQQLYHLLPSGHEPSYAIQFMSLSIIALCVVYAVLRRAPPDSDMNTLNPKLFLRALSVLDALFLFELTSSKQGTCFLKQVTLSCTSSFYFTYRFATYRGLNNQ